MTKEFLSYYSKNIDKDSTPTRGLVKFLTWAKSKVFLWRFVQINEKLSVDLLKKLKLIDYFDYVAGSDTFDYNKQSRHLTNVIEILGGSIKRTLMVGDSEVDSAAAKMLKYLLS